MSFYSDVIMRHPAFRSLTPVRQMSLLEPVTRAAVNAILIGAQAMGITLIVTETYRSAERQRQLYAQRATQLPEVGVHHYGMAADFAKMIAGKASWAGDWKFLRDLAHRNGMISGLDWGLPLKPHSFIDPDHVQRPTLGEQAGLLRGTWYGTWFPHSDPPATPPLVVSTE